MVEESERGRQKRDKGKGGGEGRGSWRERKEKEKQKKDEDDCVEEMMRIKGEMGHDNHGQKSNADECVIGDRTDFSSQPNWSKCR